jgi:hypothetical protein
LSKSDAATFLGGRQIGALPLLITATGIAGLAGYLVTWCVFRGVGPASYSTFALFWSALYLVIGALSGIQQEFARATSPVSDFARTMSTPARARPSIFALGAAVASVAIIFTVSVFLPPTTFGENGAVLMLPLAAGVAFYVFVAVLSGALYGVSRWGILAALIACDAVLRVAFVVAAIPFSPNTTVLAWLVVAPFVLAPILLSPVLKRVLKGHIQVDVGYRKLAWNAARTVTASAATGILVSGFPLILGLTSQDISPALLGQLIFVITLTRAPLVITVMSLQSYLVVQFKMAADRVWTVFAKIVGLISAAAVFFAVVAWFVGNWALDLVAGATLSMNPLLIAILVLSSGLVAILSVSGAVVLAANNHVAYATGWLAAAAVTVATLALPMDFSLRLQLALILGPLAGMLLHVGFMLGMRRNSYKLR